MLYDLPGGPEMRVLQLNTLCSNKREGAYQIGFSPLMRSLPMRPAGKEWPNKADYLFFFYRGGATNDYTSANSADPSFPCSRPNHITIFTPQ